MSAKPPIKITYEAEDATGTTLNMGLGPDNLIELTVSVDSLHDAQVVKLRVYTGELKKRCMILKFDASLLPVVNEGHNIFVFDLTKSWQDNIEHIRDITLQNAIAVVEDLHKQHYNDKDADWLLSGASVLKHAIDKIESLRR